LWGFLTFLKKYGQFGNRRAIDITKASGSSSFKSQIMNLQGEVLLMRFGNLFSRYRAVSKWSGLLAAIAMALLTVAASAQMVGSEKGKKHRDTQKTEDQAKKKKVDEKAYKDALKSIPPSSEKSDPWKSMR
jgi:hypothetical protein